MRNINDNEWILINEIIYKINTTQGIHHVQQIFLDLMKHLIPYDSALFYLKTPGIDEFKKDPVCVNYDLDTANNYILVGLDKDYTVGIMQCSKCMVCNETDLMPDDERVQTEYYKLFLAPKGLHYGLQVTFVHNGLLLGIVSLLRKKEGKDFGEKDVFILDMLKEHMAYRLSLELLNPHNPKSHNYKDLTQLMAKYDLTRREVEILQLMVEDYTNEEIGVALVISNNTIKKHVINVYKKMEVSSRLQLFKLVHQLLRIEEGTASR